MSLGDSALKFGTKCLPQNVLTGAVFYLSYEDIKPNQKLSPIREKFARLAAFTLNLTQLEFQHVEGQKDELVRKQKESLLEQRITKYVIGIQALFKEVSLKHLQLNALTPTKELEDYLVAYHDSIPNVTLPFTDNKNRIFQSNLIEKRIKNGLVIISYLIPLAYTELYREMVVIPAANEIGMAYIMENGQHF